MSVTTTLMLGDCLKRMKDIPSGTVDMICCDLPYGTTTCAWDEVIPFRQLWFEYRRVTRPNAAIVLTASQPFTTVLIRSNMQDFRYELIWKKERPTNPLLCKRQPPKYHENICVFYRHQPTYNPTRIPRLEANKRNNSPRAYSDATKGNSASYTDLTSSGSDDTIYASNILEFSMQRGLHPTQKPVPLMEYLIRTYTNEGDTVLDNTMGSGTAGVACVNANRNFIGIERDEKYFAICEQRIADAKARVASSVLEPS